MGLSIDPIADDRQLAIRARWSARYGLTPAQTRVCLCLLRGMTRPDAIAAHLHLSHNTVREHVRVAMKRLGACCRAELVRGLWPDYAPYRQEGEHEL